MKWVYGLRLEPVLPHAGAYGLIKRRILVCCILFILTVASFPSCKLINPATPVPAYLRIDSINLTTDYATEGSRNNAITDAWVLVDEQIIGVYQMPVSVPIISSGVHSIIIQPGVILNGIAATRINYPFYTSYTANINLEPGKIVSAQPSVTYNNCTFSILEDFDQAGITFTQAPLYSDSIHIINDPSINLEGKCGAALLNASHPSFEFITIDSFYMPLGSSKYMELNYKGNYSFTVGLQSFINGIPVNSGDDIVVLKPVSSWQKIYVDLNLGSALEPGAYYFKVYIYGILDLTQQSSASIYFDNIKVIHNG